MELRSKIVDHLLYGGISKEEYLRVKDPVAESNHRALRHWSILVSIFWIYCLLMSLKSAGYAACRPAYASALAVCILCFLVSCFLIPRIPAALPLFMCIFRLSLMCGGIGIAVLQPNARSLTMFATAIMAPSIFIDNTAAAVIPHALALIVYILLGRNVIDPDIYSWGLGNYILFSVFGFLIGNAINKERFERYVFADAAEDLAEMQTRFAYYDQMTGLKNRRAFVEDLKRITQSQPDDFRIVMADVNGLKRTNDTFGHEAGDELIVGAADCLTAAFAQTGTVYRIGGDEFCVIMTGTAENAACCLKALEAATARREGRGFSGISISYGVAFGGDHDDVDAMIAEADRRMYEHKRNYYLSNGIDRRKNQ